MRTAQVRIDLKKTQSIAGRAVRRAAAFTAIGQKAWSDEKLDSLQVVAPFSTQFLPNPLPGDLAAEAKRAFRIWICGHVLGELVLGLGLFLDEIFEGATYLSLNGKTVTEEALADIGRMRNDTNLASKVQRLANTHGIKSDFYQHADSWARARNAHLHNNGLVRQRDFNPGAKELTVSWKELQIKIGDKKNEQLKGMIVEKEEPITVGVAVARKVFVLNEQVEFSPQEILSLCFTANGAASEVAKAMTERFSALVEPQQ